MKSMTYQSISENGVICASFSRAGGLSPLPFDSLNMSYHVGDQYENVLHNRKAVKDALGIKYLVSGQQVHDDKIYCVKEQPEEDIEIKAYDAFITNIPNIGLMIQQADCQAVMLFDPVKKAVGIAHAGWRGSLLNIISKTIAAMSKEYATNPSDLLAPISPSLGPCCAEFVNYRTELAQAFHKYQVRENYFDFWAISCDQLKECRVKPENIEVAEICTVCNHDFFSYRRDKVTGRFASIIGLK